jgi:hypothetical protein
MRATAQKLRRSLVRTNVTAVKSPAPAPAGSVQLRHLEKMSPLDAPRAAPVRWYRLRLLPRTIQLCIHCRESTAGFWISRKHGKTVRRPWCLSCCDCEDDRAPFRVAA